MIGIKEGERFDCAIRRTAALLTRQKTVADDIYLI